MVRPALLLFFLIITKRYAFVGVQQTDFFMLEVFNQQHDLITFSVVGEVN